MSKTIALPLQSINVVASYEDNTLIPLQAKEGHEEKTIHQKLVATELLPKVVVARVSGNIIDGGMMENHGSTIGM